MVELLYEIQRDRIPRLLGNWKLFKKSVRSMVHRLCMGTSGAQFAVILDIGLKSQPVVMHTYDMKGLRLAKVSCEGMVMQVLKNT